jgi:hypothetical protein
MTPSGSEFFTAKMPSVIPVLSTVIPELQIPETLRVALDARQLEKEAFMALAEELVQELRPEMARLATNMATELVQSSIRQVWIKRIQMDR